MARTTAVGAKPIFLSYRRDDTSGYAGRLQDALAERFGDDHIFRDVMKIAPGRDYVEVIDDALTSCSAMLVVIGDDWLEVRDATGRRRLDNPDDVLRQEVVAALARDTLVIPVLVERAPMPAEADLPEPLRPLARRQAIELNDASWDSDVDRLAATIAAATGTTLRPAQGRPTGRRIPVPAVAAAVGALALLVVLVTVRALTGGGPAPMTGRLNIAVAEFSELDAKGDVVKTSAATRLSKSVDRMLDQEVKAIDGGREVQHRLIGRLAGADPDRRAQAAEQAGRRIDADIVVYGVLQTDASGASELAPEFFLTDRLLLDAGEVVGHHQLGAPVSAAGGDAERASVQNRLLDLLSERISVLAEITVALGDYSVEDYRGALDHLAVAERLPGWAPQDGKGVLYLLLGNVSGKLGRLDEAEGWYDRALALQPDYSRASLGKAEVVFQRAKGQCEQGQVDAAGLRRSLDLYTAARAGRLPADAEVPAKASFGEGRILACLSQALVADRWSEAEARFVSVVQAYGGRNERLRELAAESHAQLGTVYTPFGPNEAGARADYLRAAGEYTSAITLYQKAGVHRERQALFYSSLGDVLAKAQDRSKAASAYANAIRLAPDPATAAKYREQRDNSIGRSS